MSAADDFTASVRTLAAAVRATADDPGDQVRLLRAMADFSPSGAVGDAETTVQDAVSAVCRRAALTELARAVGDSTPRSYDEAVGLRDIVCGLLNDEVIAAGDTGDDATCAALRALSTAVGELLTARAGDLAALQTVRTGEPVPALVLAHRLYGDASRADEVSAYAAADDPNFVPTEFKALGR